MVSNRFEFVICGDLVAFTTTQELSADYADYADWEEAE